MDELTKRNFHTLSDGLKDLRAQVDDLKAAGIKKDATIQQLMSQQQTMQQQLSVMMAKFMGSGATT